MRWKRCSSWERWCWWGLPGGQMGGRCSLIIRVPSKAAQLFASAASPPPSSTQFISPHTHTHFAKGHSSFNCEELANSRGLSRGRSGENLPRPFDAWHRLKNLILTFFYRHYESQALPAEKQRDVYSHFKPFTHEYAVLLFVSTWGEFLAECHF